MARLIRHREQRMELITDFKGIVLVIFMSKQQINDNYNYPAHHILGEVILIVGQMHARANAWTDKSMEKL